ncbi:MAG TPA: malonyl-ACP O-methyltransferase BioC [Steroidobacteraceae bacterium]|nr:malonyl-ACP O-methyltransferase BioC [Steroidobacteraceae bacterium]
MAAPHEFELDPRRVRRAFDRAARTYDRAAAVQGEIRSRLLERLDLIRLQPKTVLDLGAGTGVGARALKDRYPAAQVIALDSSLGMLQRARIHQRWLKPFRTLAADAAKLPLREGSVDLVISNLMLEWCSQPDAVFRELRRVARPQGLVMFTTLGPDTLKELRAATTQVWGQAQLHRFIDMHDIGDALMRAGFADPVMDTETLGVTFASVRSLVDELKQTGALSHRPLRPGLTSHRRLRTLEDRFPPEKAPHRFTLEVVYGHAWVPTGTRTRRTDAEFAIPLTSIGRRMV